MSNFITNNDAKDLKKRLIELIQKSDELKFTEVNLAQLDLNERQLQAIDDGQIEKNGVKR